MLKIHCDFSIWVDEMYLRKQKFQNFQFSVKTLKEVIVCYIEIILRSIFKAQQENCVYKNAENTCTHTHEDKLNFPTHT